MTATSPLVSIVLATHDAASTLGAAIDSVLAQTVRDLELVVVDDASRDTTEALLQAYSDTRLVVVRNADQLGLAASLNRGLEHATAPVVGRLDADDVALPRRLEQQLAALRARAGLAVVGSAALEIDEAGRPGALHEMPAGAAAVRWHLLFGCPFFHPSVLVDRSVLDAHDLRYDTSFAESEDYDLWARLLRVADGDNVHEALVLKRVHPGQATRRRRDVQRDFQRQVALREIAFVAPELRADGAELAWSLGAGEALGPGQVVDAVEAFLALHRAFEGRHPGDPGLSRVRVVAARALARAAGRGSREARGLVLRQALALDPLLLAHAARDRARRHRTAARARDEAAAVATGRRVTDATAPVRVVVVSPEPTPYRAPLLDLVSARPELDLTVIYAAHTVAGRVWDVEPQHRAVFLRGAGVPGVRRILRHDYPVTPGVFGALRAARPEVVVVNGWSTFAAQAAIGWSARRRIPYLLLASSHDAVTRAWWRRAVRRPVVPPIVRGAWGAFALGTLSRASLVEQGVPPERVRLFANTIDVAAVSDRADELARSRPELREALGVGADDIAVLSAGRLVPEKAHDVLVRAVAMVGDPRLALVIAGDGPERPALERLAEGLGVRLRLTGDLRWERLLEAYVAADVFALLSRWEPWGVVVNEAAACGKPLLLSDQVGAAADLLEDGRNGSLVAAGDADAAAAALRHLVERPEAIREAGTRSRQIVTEWGYQPSVDSFVDAVLEAAGRRPTR